MAGFREFAAGEPLTSANVDDFLAKQAVMKFADAAARDAALGTTVVAPNALREGMVAYLDDDNEVQYFDGTAWEPVSEPPAGIGSNVVQTALTTTFTSSATTYVSVTGMLATITPTTNTSKVLVIVQMSYGLSGGGAGNRGYAGMRISGGNATTYVGDAAGSRNLAIFGGRSNNVDLSQTMMANTMVFLDSPATTSPVGYQLEISLGAGGGLFALNRSNDDANSNERWRGASSITAIEVAA